jgi:hypothetical protein
VPDVHHIAAGTAASIEEEGFFLFVLVKNQRKVAVGKDDAATEETV